MGSMKHLWQQGCCGRKMQQNLKHVLWVRCGGMARCRKSDTRSLHSLTISISLCSVHICQISDSESDSDNWLCLRHHCSQASDSYIFSTVLWLYRLSPSLRMSGIYVVGLIRNWPMISVCLGWEDHVMEKTWLVRLHAWLHC